MAEKKKKGGMFSAAKKFLTTRHMDYVKKDQGFIKKAAKLAAENPEGGEPAEDGA